MRLQKGRDHVRLCVRNWEIVKAKVCHLRATRSRSPNPESSANSVESMDSGRVDLHKCLNVLGRCI